MRIKLRLSWFSLTETLRFLGLLIAALAVGALVGHTLALLTLVLFLYSIYALYVFGSISRWHQHTPNQPPPEGRSSWFDLTEQMYRQSRAEHRHKRRLLRILRAFREAAAALPDGVVILDEKRRVQWLNESAAQLMRMQSPRDRGKYMDDFLPTTARSWLLTKNSTEPLWDVPAPHNEHIRLSLRLIQYGDHQSLLVIRDISRLLRLEQVRQSFVANVSHELRTPLTVLHGYLDMMQADELPPPWDNAVIELRRQSQRMMQIVDDLLTLSKIEAQTEVVPEIVDMSAMLSTLAREAQILSQGRHTIVVQCEYKGNLQGSPQQLYSAFSNLVSNAVRYTPANGHIRITWRLRSDHACFEVQDNGYGIPTEHLPRITERFYRVSTSRSRDLGGTGLGLAIVKHVLNVYQAGLEIESKPGIGSTFVCAFHKKHTRTSSN
jgi:two-component system phosphate regulon sensor histidine kinase PhoR